MHTYNKHIFKSTKMHSIINRHLYTRLLANEDLVFIQTQTIAYTTQYVFAFSTHSYVDTIHAYICFQSKTVRVSIWFYMEGWKLDFVGLNTSGTKDDAF